MELEIKKEINKMDYLLKKIDLIPEWFDGYEEHIGVDLDHLNETVSEWIEDDLKHPLSYYLKSFQSINSSFEEYYNSYKNEINDIKFIQYTDPNSVLAIMDVIGSKGVLNTENGLNIFSVEEVFRGTKEDIKLQKGDWLLIRTKFSNYIEKITNEQKLEINRFLESSI